MVPTNILICVTPDEKMLGSNFRKKNFISSLIFIFKLKIGLKFFLTKNNKIINCKNPATETAYDKINTSDMLNHFEKNNELIKIIFNIIGAAAAAANLLKEFSIAPKKEARHIKNRKGKVILLKSTASYNFSGSLIKPGAIKKINCGIKIAATNTKNSKIIKSKLNTFFAKLSASILFFASVPA